MPRITEESVARIKDSADIVSVVGKYLQLKRAGYSWKACCPFHNEKTPSFHVNPSRQSFHCFGCGVGGDAVKFLMMYENLDYPTALRRLADMNGIPVIEEEENPEMARQRRQRGRIIELNQLAADYYHRKLCRSRNAAHAREYLKGRGINIEIAKEWNLGWAPPDFRELQQAAAASKMDNRLLVDAYLLGKGPSGVYPVFRDRLMFPIHNLRGEVVGFSGRVMQADKDPRKYVNTAETIAFHKGELLFGLYKATKAIGQAGMTVVICEGQLDVIACHELANVRNAVAGLGTAFTEDHARTLAKYAKRAILCYDGDQAGIKASEKTYRILAQAGLDVFQAALPPGDDPDSLIRTQGAEALQQAVANARPYLENRCSHELNQSQTDANARAALIPRMADLAADISSDVRREVALTDLATRLNIGLDVFRNMVGDILRNRRKQEIKQARNAPRQRDAHEHEQGYEEGEYMEQASVTPIPIHNSIRGLIELMYSHENAQNLLLNRVEELQEPIRRLSGGIILQRLLEALPRPGNEDAWQTFTNQLPPEQALALRNLELQRLPEADIERIVDDTCAHAAQATLHTNLDQLRSRIRSRQVSKEESRSLMEEMMRLNKMFSDSQSATPQP